MKRVMKVLASSTLVAGLLLGSVIPEQGVAHAAENEIKVNVDGKFIDIPDAKPYIDSSSARTLVPVRFVSQSLGAQVNWDDAKRTVTITRAGKTTVLKVGEKKALVAGKSISFDSAATIKDSRTFVPLRFVSEAYGAQVIWDKINKDVYIVTKPKVRDAYGTKLFQQFQGSLKVKNGILSGKLPIKSTHTLSVHFEAGFKNGKKDLILENGESFAFTFSEVDWMAFSVYDRAHGKRLVTYSYLSLPDLTPLDVKDIW